MLASRTPWSGSRATAGSAWPGEWTRPTMPAERERGYAPVPLGLLGDGLLHDAPTTQLGEPHAHAADVELENAVGVRVPLELILDLSRLDRLAAAVARDIVAVAGPHLLRQRAR